MNKRILIMGLPGAGKTTLAAALTANLFPHALWINADQVREEYNDWDFTIEGRLRQATRMRSIADTSTNKYVVADFVCPLAEMREIYSAHTTIWLDTVSSSLYKDTDSLFVPPTEYQYRFTEKNAETQAELIAKELVL
jgi:adenylylsulfate kinase